MEPASTSPLLLAYYGDDFTGSTDCLEALSLAGVRSVLLFGPPTAGTLRRFPDVQAIGVAGVGRSLSPEQMDRELPSIFTAIKELGAPLFHYKVCSTFDSSPTIGSIGRAIELGQAATGTRTVPLVVGVPALGRYCLFGNLFARAGDGAVYRLDRHPTMSCHPTTPMQESDLRRHLAQQTNQKMGLVDVLSLASASEKTEKAFGERQDFGEGVVLFDTLTAADLKKIGAIVWQWATVSGGSQFIVGSSGVEYALTAHWREIGLLPPQSSKPTLTSVKQVLAVCGSCSPVTAEQIDSAASHGFVEVPLKSQSWAADDVDTALNLTIETVLQALTSGKSVIVHSARGADDPRIAAAKSLIQSGSTSDPPAVRLGRALAAIVQAAVEQTGIRRVAVAGGDTSGYLAGALGIDALQFAAPIAPGVPLCHAHAARSNSPFDGLEICFKGGQVGGADFFERVLHGER